MANEQLARFKLDSTSTRPNDPSRLSPPRRPPRPRTLPTVVSSNPSSYDDSSSPRYTDTLTHNAGNVYANYHGVCSVRIGVAMMVFGVVCILIAACAIYFQLPMVQPADGIWAGIVVSGRVIQNLT